MKKLLQPLFLLLLAPYASLQAQSLIAQESFETEGNNSRYTSNTFDNRGGSPNPSPCPCGTIDYFLRAQDPVTGFGTSTTPKPITGENGTWFWASEDVMSIPITRPKGFVQLNPVAITGYTALQVKVLLAHARGGETTKRILPTDTLSIKVSFNGTSYTTIGRFIGDETNGPTTTGEFRQDANMNNSVADDKTVNSPFLTPTMQDFTFNVAGTGSQLWVKVEYRITGGTKELAMDHIRVYGTITNNAAPVLANIAASTLAYTESDPATPIATTLTVTDADNANLTSATVQFTSGFVSGEDVLGFATQNNITGSFNNVSGLLTLSGTSSVANYQTALRSVTYQNTNTVNPSTFTNRVVRFTVNDGISSSNPVTRTISVTPVVNGAAALPYTETFETDGLGTRYSAYSYYSSNTCQMFQRASAGTNNCYLTDPTGAQGSFYWEAEGTNDASNPTTPTSALTISPINVSGYANLQATLAVAAPNAANRRYDSNDRLQVQYRFDNGTWTNLALFVGNGDPSVQINGDLKYDANNNGIADAGEAVMTSAFADYLFSIPGTGTTLELRMVATLTSQAEITFDNLRVTGVFNNPPTDIALSASSINENQPVNTVIGTLTSTDPNAGQTHTYTLVSGTGSTDNASFNISGNQLRTSALFDFETKSSYSIRLRTTDNGTPNNSYEEVFTITVNNLNEAPTALNLTGNTIAENQPANTVIGSFSSTDQDAGNTFTYTLVSGTGSTDNASFNISGNQLRSSASFDFEIKNSYTIRVRTSDQGGLFTENTFTISVTDVNEAPSALSLSNSTIAENAPVNTGIGNFISTDQDAGNTFTYTLVSGTGSTDNGSFNISGNQLRSSASFDFEIKNSYTIRVRTTDQAGLFTENTFAISVTNVNEVPVIGSQSFSINENSANGTVVGTVAASDPDAGTTLSYSITGGNTGGAFAISNSGQLTVANVAMLDFETTPTFSLTVQVADNGTPALTSSATITINLNDLVENAISTGTIAPSSLCQGGSVSVPFTASGSYSAGNVFTAQLSSAVGNFASPVTIGTLTSTTSGSISATIPSGTATGSLYRIRVISSNPAITGTDNGSNLSINALPTAGITNNSGTTELTCTTTSISVSATGGVSYAWSNGANTASTSFTGPGTYTVTVTGNGGCTATSSITITQEISTPTVLASSTPTTGICPGNTVTLNASGAVSYSWNTGQTGNSITVNPAVTTTYTVTGTGSNGCTATATTTVTINPGPTVSASASPSTFMEGNTTTLSVTSPQAGVTYTWSGADLDATTGTSVTATPASDGTFVYTVTADNGTCTSTATVTVTVQPFATGSPMAGTYTVNKNSPTAARNFTNLHDFTQALFLNGISGNVTVNVVANSGPYNERLKLMPYAGTAAGRRITINGNGNTLSPTILRPIFATEGFGVVLIDGADNITINNFNITHSPVSQFGWGIQLINNAQNVIIQNNQITVNGTSTAQRDYMGIVASDSYTQFNYPGNNVTNLSILNNTITGGYEGIRINGNPSAYSPGIVISGNTITDAYKAGMYLQYLDAPVVGSATGTATVPGNNVVTMRGGNVLSQGIHLSLISGNMRVQRNRVTNAGQHGLYLLQVNTSGAAAPLIANNMIGGGFQNNVEAAGIVLNDVDNAQVVFNSVNVDNASAGIGLDVLKPYSSNLDIRNNSLAYTGGGTGYAMRIGYASVLSTLDYNNYYSNGTSLAYFERKAYSTLPSLQQAVTVYGTTTPILAHDMNSISADPMYVSASNLHAQAGSPLGDAGATIPGLVTDYDGQVRSGLSDIGADEFMTGSARLIASGAASGSLEVSAYPNPLPNGNSLQVRLRAAQAGSLYLQLQDLAGRTVLTLSREIEEGNSVQALDMSSLSQGIYLLSIQQGSDRQTIKVIKE